MEMIKENGLYIDTDIAKDVYCKLKQLEGIEEELGCPLEVIFKALKQMFVFNKENEKIELLLVLLSNNSNDLYLYGFVEDTTQEVYLSLKDYGKTWMLTKELLWERKEKVKLTDDEKAILRNISKEYKWIARDNNRMLFVFTIKPIKSECIWNIEEEGVTRLRIFEHLFQFIQWEDEEPYLIEDLLKEGDENE